MKLKLMFTKIIVIKHRTISDNLSQAKQAIFRTGFDFTVFFSGVLQSAMLRKLIHTKKKLACMTGAWAKRGEQGVSHEALNECEAQDEGKRKSPTTEKQIRSRKKTSNTFCYTIPTGLAWPEENSNWEMTPYTKPATAKRNLEGDSYYILSQGKISYQEYLLPTKIDWSVPYTRRLWSCLRHLMVV